MLGADVVRLDVFRHGDDAGHRRLLQHVSGGLWCSVNGRFRVHAVCEQHIQRWRLDLLLGVSRRYVSCGR